MPRNAPEGVFSTPAANKPRLLDHVRERLRYLHYSLRTERGPTRTGSSVTSSIVYGV